ncbi:hypothetical protein BV25DRAFT_1899608 [Artomyces pyxidatus]|uniref:Uncharacterized protein n=1 Tax=Artomyces pyxidatus TaxID=48021 RepID=A0ACB8T217_9AGAM|nr:hypothetical protein BV25DRAFT_1899608 [Artomyces pyxidatus]
MATVTLTARYNKQSEWDNLHGRRAKTPWVSAAVSMTCVGIMWLIIFVMWVFKSRQRRRDKRRIRQGRKPKHTQPVVPNYIVPPDPAILLGQRKPGDCAFEGRNPAIEMEETGLNGKVEDPSIAKHATGSGEAVAPTLLSSGSAV